MKGKKRKKTLKVIMLRKHLTQSPCWSIYSSTFCRLKMPFPERNPPNVPILPGPDYKYLMSNPPQGIVETITNWIILWIQNYESILLFTNTVSIMARFPQFFQSEMPHADIILLCRPRLYEWDNFALCSFRYQYLLTLN